MNIREARSGSVVVLATRGRLDVFSATELEAQIIRLQSRSVFDLLETHETFADACL